MGWSERITERVHAQVATICDFPDAQRDALVSKIRQRHGDGVEAILIYGSYLRGKRDTLLDFYVLLDGYAALESRWQGVLARLLPPNVYQIHHGSPPDEIRAKYAALSLKRFEYAVKQDFHSYFWARFAQPCGIVWVRNRDVERRIIEAICQSTATFIRRVVPLLPDRFDAADLFSTGLAQTYRCEFRSEQPGHAQKLFGYWPDYYRDMTLMMADSESILEPVKEAGMFRNCADRGSRRRAGFSWAVRRFQGRVLSTLRILKAALTFDGALDYLMWKIKRHSGVYIEPTALQRKYPIVFAWPLLFRLWRRGAFR